VQACVRVCVGRWANVGGWGGGKGQPWPGQHPPCGVCGTVKRAGGVGSVEQSRSEAGSKRV